MIEAISLTKTFSEKNGQIRHQAVRNVSFSLEKGSFSALVGESGSGKTTLARMLSGLIAPTEGKVILDGNDIFALKRKERMKIGREVQLVLQDSKASMDPRFTVYETIREPMRNLLSLSREEEKRTIDRLMERMSLPVSMEVRRAHELSGGELKRISIARALAARPKILIFDESVSGLDVLLRKDILDLIREIHRELGMTSLLITHDLDVALYMAERIMVMKDGEIVEDGNYRGSSEVFTHPYTKLLLDSISPYQVVQKEKICHWQKTNIV